ncbi:hypothetical protein JCM30760_26630 [Thiomicrorhabdus hydrogeniphila]
MNKQDQSFLGFIPENSNEGVLMREGIQALYRERNLAFNVANSLATLKGSPFPKRSDFELPDIEKIIRRLDMEIMPNPL